MSDRFNCWNCGNDLSDEPRPVSRQANCARCFTELHCCRLCVHYDPNVREECQEEDRADVPKNKESANFCEYFSPQVGVFSGERTQKSATARSELDALFAPKDD